MPPSLQNIDKKIRDDRLNHVGYKNFKNSYKIIKKIHNPNNLSPSKIKTINYYPNKHHKS